MSAYIVELLAQIAIYAALVAALDLVAGYTGMISVCQAAFFSIGAYAAAIVTSSRGLGFVMGVAVAVCLGVALAQIAGQLKAEYFLLVTFALQTVVSGILLNWIGLTRGGMGITGIAPISSGHTLSAALLLASCLGIILVSRYIGVSPFGRVLVAIRDDERFASALGKNIPRAKISVVGVSAALTAAAGFLYAHWVQYVSPESFDINRSILLLSMLILGGANTATGPIRGAAVLVIGPEVARLAIGGPIAANLQGMFYGAVLVAAVAWRSKSALWLAGP